MSRNSLSIVLPCYNEEAVVEDSTNRLLLFLNDLQSSNIVSADSNLLLIDDGSSDNTWQIIERLHVKDNRITGIKLSNNEGHQKALLAGLNEARAHADMIISMDIDLQDDMEVIPEMISKFNNNGCDIVYGVRNNRSSDTFPKRVSAHFFYKFMHLLGVDMIYNHADFRLMSRRTVNELCNYGERNLFLRGLVPLLGYKTGRVYYERKSRKAGKSKYPFIKMFNFAIDGITSFSVKPVRMVIFLSFLFILTSFIIGGYVLYSYSSGWTVPGWTFLMLSLWFIGGCILLSLGIIGEYIGKIYTEVKHRPLYHIEKKLI